MTADTPLNNWHINERGDAKRCNAKIRCQFATVDNPNPPHFATKEEAQAGAEIVSKNAHWSKVISDARIQIDKFVETYENCTPEQSRNPAYRDSYRESLSGEYRAINAARLELRGEQLPQHKVDFDEVSGLEAAIDEVVAFRSDFINPPYRADRYKANSQWWREAAARYRLEPEIEKLQDGADDPRVIPDDTLLYNLQHPGIGQNLYASIIFPEKDLKPVLQEKGVEGVEAQAFNSFDQWGIVYTVKTPKGDKRSFTVYQSPSSDELYVNGKTNWDSTDGDGPGPMAASPGRPLARFRAGEFSQAAETLGTLLKEAQDGTLGNDQELLAN